MGAAVDDLAKGPDQQWDAIAEIWKARRIDGIGATCFVVGLGELFARAPTIFLERHLAGDPAAKELAREGYNLLYATTIMKGRSFNPGRAQANALSIYRQRASIADAETGKQIEDFIRFITRAN